MFLKFKVLVFLLFSLMVARSQEKKEISLTDLQDSLYYNEIVTQGRKLFSSSECHVKKEKYLVIPQLLVGSKVNLSELTFGDAPSFLENFSFEREHKRRFLIDISWNVVLKRNPCVSSSSDFKQFYCFNPWNVQQYISTSKVLKMENIRYTFYIEGVNLSIKFIVSKDYQVYVYNSRENTFYSLPKFNELYEAGEIERFEDDPFSNKMINH